MNNIIENILSFKEKFPNHTIFFRGESKSNRKIIPSLYRNDIWVENEDKMFREYILRNPKEFEDEKTTFEKLVKMQHYSLPTRLLDITSNALVALFFSVDSNDIKNNGVLLMFAVPDY